MLRAPRADAGEVTYTATATIDQEGVLTGWSEGARRLLGHEAATVVGRPAAELLADVPETPRRARAGQQRWHGTVALRHRDGRSVELRLLAHRRTPAGGPAEWLVVCAAPADPQQPGDVLLADWAFAQSPLPLAVFDTGLRLVRANHRMERAVTLPEAAMRGLSLPHIAPGAASDEIGRQMQLAVETGEPREAAARLGPELGRPTVLTPLKDAAGRVRALCLTAPRRSQDSAVRPWTQDPAPETAAPSAEPGPQDGSGADYTRTAQALADVAVPRLADFVTVDLLDSPMAPNDTGGPAAGSTVVLHRAAVRAVPDGRPVPTPGAGDGTTTAYQAGSPPAESLATGSAVLYDTTDPAVAAWTETDPGAAWLRAYGTRSLMVVPLVAGDSRLGVALFGRHTRPEPFGPEDLRLAEELTARTAAALHKARRTSWARTTTMALQHSLLPHTLPEQAALEVATRYLPAATRAGVGGDWFDVIPLSAARVALVVGDVVGHGIRASATMGRLRTAVRTLADVDLPADELLTHLDDLVLRLAADEGGAGPDSETAGGIGTTCLYAVYDPVVRRCTLARAGHPPPAVVTPDGAVRFLDVPAGPPLGLGGLPFEAAEAELPEGSLLALYTDGLLEARDHDIDEALDKMFAALARPAATLDSVCDRVLAELLSHRPDDDIALLVARTRALHEDRVASWDLDSDPSVVARARRAVSAQLAVWGLDDAAFVTELLVSELVTNAVRYGRPPVRLRLIHQDSTLVSEVHDASGTTPHMRRARVFDEGGRGLLLVAQLAERWGTRHDRVGKTVWAEQSLTGP
ncbi:SpoIIE family protein phosphatase [Streptomyces sp. MUM 136J]|nr:SpoIIE family protein phosphatase [Streptomyces sp. MUM 2J]MCH0572846.1 SpoIIE family protein phosphatase [Streptomyces sp. MUM 136J]